MLKRILSRVRGLVVPVKEGDRLYGLVKDKMQDIDNQMVLTRIKSLEKVVSFLAQQVSQTNKNHDALLEIMVQTSTNVEEMMNALDGYDGSDDEPNEDTDRKLSN